MGRETRLSKESALPSRVCLATPFSCSLVDPLEIESRDIATTLEDDPVVSRFFCPASAERVLEISDGAVLVSHVTPRGTPLPCVRRAGSEDVCEVFFSRESGDAEEEEVSLP